jgi:hypothetical protein
MSIGPWARPSCAQTRLGPAFDLLGAPAPGAVLRRRAGAARALAQRRPPFFFWRTSATTTVVFLGSPVILRVTG